MTASPPNVNGHARPAMPVLEDWQAVAPEQVEEQRNPEPAAADVEVVHAKVWAEAEERRVAAEAAAEERRIKAQAEADAIRVKAEEDARRLRLANDKLERKAREDDAASEARIAESHQRRDDANRARQNADRTAAEERQSEEQAAQEIADADDKWRKYAIRFAVVCGIVSLPVQMSFFWNPQAPWMAAAPIMLEGAAWVVHRGARAAAVSKRPLWHYRTIVWLLAFVAAAVNLYHGLHSFDPGTALSTAFASIAGPGVWDLHEHGRIRKRDGALTRRERKAAESEAKRIAREKAAEEARRTAEKEAADKAASGEAKELAETRAKEFPKVWEHARKLAADLGSTTITEAIWKRAKLDVDGALPGESAEVFRMRNAAEMRVEAARLKKPVSTLSKTTNAQRASQMPATKKQRIYNPPARAGRRTRGDTAPYVSAARTQAAITAKNAAKNTRPNDI